MEFTMTEDEIRELYPRMKSNVTYAVCYAGECLEYLLSIIDQLRSENEDLKRDKPKVIISDSMVLQAQARIEKLEGALQKLVDCDFVITLPDRMDAVRDIARKALLQQHCICSEESAERCAKAIGEIDG